MVCIKSVRIRFKPSIPRLLSFLHIFLMLKAMVKKAKSIVTLSFPKWRKRRYAILYFICPKTASGSMHCRPLCLIPSRQVRLPLAFRLYSFSLCWPLWCVSSCAHTSETLPIQGNGCDQGGLPTTWVVLSFATPKRFYTRQSGVEMHCALLPPALNEWNSWFDITVPEPFLSGTDCV